MSKVVNGFIRSQNKRLVNDAGEILLKGWGIGNWLLCEGYMWKHDESKRMDRPNRIEQVIRELVGTKAAAEFWLNYRKNYFTQEDVARIKAQGYNSIRLPINWRLFMEDEPGITFDEYGFDILDEVVKWCEQADLYVWIDLHGAPGGQTGANIDDCIDDVPRLYMDDDKFEKGLALWEEIAKRYADNPVVAGYDLLNEPIRPENGPDVPDCEQLVPELIRFYQQAIKRIRAIDKHHCFSIEGHHWATDTTIFNQQYDDNWVLHFHRYWDNPEENIFEKFIALREKYNVPLWLGETGENTHDWFSAITAICDREHISYHFWPYKKMGNDNGSAEIPVPTNWDQIIGYSKQGAHPGFAQSQKILAQFLENMKLEHCILHDHIDMAILRNGEYVHRTPNFIGQEERIQAQPKNENLFNYRRGFGLELELGSNYHEEHDKHHDYWRNYDLVLQAGESVQYDLPNFDFSEIVLKIDQVYEACEFEMLGQHFSLASAHGEITISRQDFELGETILLSCQKGKVQFEYLRFR